MGAWFQSHTWVASWAGPVIGVTGLVVNLLKKQNATEKDRTKTVLYVGWLTMLGGFLIPGMPSDIHTPLAIMVSTGFVWIGMLAARGE